VAAGPLRPFTQQFTSKQSGQSPSTATNLNPCSAIKRRVIAARQP
jgi:hypothetical protein